MHSETPQESQKTASGKKRRENQHVRVGSPLFLRTSNQRSGGRGTRGGHAHVASNVSALARPPALRKTRELRASELPVREREL